MSIPRTVQAYLEQHDIHYDVLPHPHTETLEQAAEVIGIALDRIARALLLKHAGGLFMAVLPASHIVDFTALQERLGGPLELVEWAEVEHVFGDCEPGSLPPLGSAYGMETLVDEDSFAEVEEIWFEPGRHDCLVAVNRHDFWVLQRDAGRAAFAHPSAALAAFDTPTPALVAQALKRFILARQAAALQELPPRPPMVAAALALRGDAAADTADLAGLIGTDPEVGSRLVAFAASPYYGHHGRIRSVQQAIDHVLGFELALSIVLGIVVARALPVSHQGPLGLRAFWRHGIHAAALSHKLALVMPMDLRPAVGTAFLTGLLHDLGHLVFGRAFPQEFYLLNRLVKANPGTSVTELERTVIGVRHEQIGAWLSQSWDMPEEVTVAVRWHHEDGYDGVHAVYAHLVLLADRLLRRRGVGDAGTALLPPAIMTRLGVTDEQLGLVWTEVDAQFAALDAQARHLLPGSS